MTIQCRLASTGRDCRTFDPRSSGGCTQTLIYDLEICNIGPVDMRVNEAIFQFNGASTNMVGNLPMNPVRVGQCTSMAPRRMVNVCRNPSLTAGFAAQANPPNGNSCQAEDRHTVNFPRPPPAPVPTPVAQPTQTDACSIEVGANCLIAGSQLPCTTPVAGPKTFEFTLGVFTNRGDGIRVNNLVVDTNFAGRFDLSRQVQGQVVGNPQGQSVATAVYSANVNNERQFNLEFNVAGTRLRDGQICQGQQSLSFQVG